MDVLACCRLAERSTQVVRGEGRAEAVWTSCTWCVLVFEMVAVAHSPDTVVWPIGRCLKTRESFELDGGELSMLRGAGSRWMAWNERLEIARFP